MELAGARDKLVDEADAFGSRRADHAAGQHGLHGRHRPNLLDRSHGAVEARENSELHLREADARRFIPRRNPVVAREDQFQTAADADAVDRRDDGNGKLLYSLEQRIDRLQAIDHLLLGFEVFELPDIGADDVAALLARHKDEAAHVVGVCFGFDALDDRVQLFDRATAERVGALPFPVEDRPGDTLAVDRKAPVLQLSCHFLITYLN